MAITRTNAFGDKIDYAKNERFKKLLVVLKEQGKIYNDTDFAIKIDNSKPYVSELKNKKRNLTEQFVMSICEAFPEVNSSWLLTGEGAMFVDLFPSEVKKNSSDVEKTTSEEKLKQIPILPISAQGGSLNDFTHSVRKYDCEWMSSPISDADFAIEVAGDSMAPEYPAGSRVLIKRINESAFVEWGKVYVIDTENGVVLKRVVPADDENYIRCVSINPAPDYAPFNIPKSSIFGMYIVLGLYAKK